jgi:hypothetical protein
MPRTLAGGEGIKSITSVRFVRQALTPVTTTTTAAVTGAGTETTVAVSGITGFVAADECLIIGDGGVELVTIGTPNATMPVTPPPLIPQSSGATFARGLSVSFGKFSQGSINWTGSRQLTAIFEEIGDAPLYYMPGPTEFGCTFGLFNYNGPNIQRLMGYEEAETGDGAAEATAYQSILGKSAQTLQSEIVFVLKLLRFDGKKFELQFCNAFFEANIASNPGRTTPAILNGGVKSQALKIKQWT